MKSLAVIIMALLFVGCPSPTMTWTNNPGKSLVKKGHVIVRTGGGQGKVDTGKVKGEGDTNSKAAPR